MRTHLVSNKLQVSLLLPHTHFTPSPSPQWACPIRSLPSNTELCDKYWMANNHFTPHSFNGLCADETLTVFQFSMLFPSSYEITIVTWHQWFGLFDTHLVDRASSDEVISLQYHFLFTLLDWLTVTWNVLSIACYVPWYKHAPFST